ncbi:MAG: SDR family oxidoreductase [Gammaproteobacteria bacterium]|nr:SDR family oxidoreductase [Gammaproteobacteria bacterium]
MIVITGGNGSLGKAVVAELKKTLPAKSFAVSVRDRSKAAAYVGDGIDVRQADFSDKGSMVRAFSDAERVLIISGEAPNEIRIPQQRNAIDAAKEAGVGHIVYTSFVDHDPTSPFTFAAIHHDTEAYLARAGVGYTILRNGSYADLLPMFIGNAADSGRFEVPAGDGKASFITRADLARATAVVLSSDKYVGKTLELDGETAVSFHEIAATLSRQLGKKITYVSSDRAAYLAGLKGAGLPEFLAVAITGIHLAIAEGRFAPTSTTVREITGKSPEDVTSFLKRTFAAEAVTAA